MVKLNIIKNNADLYAAIQIAFLNDYDLINVYHIVNSGFIESVNDTYEKIINAKEIHLIECYQVTFKNQIIGYTAICRPYSYLYSFGINNNYRTQEVMSIWWDLILDKMGSKFSCALWAKNTRAINFLIKNGMKINNTDQNTIQLMYN